MTNRITPVTSNLVTFHQVPADGETTVTESSAADVPADGETSATESSAAESSFPDNYVGCYGDEIDDRVLTLASTDSDTMSVEVR